MRIPAEQIDHPGLERSNHVGGTGLRCYGRSVDAIAAHYTVGDLERRILDAVASAGIPLDRLTVDDLAPADEFHIGGRAATEALLDEAGFPPGAHVLDVGSGLGGTARYLAAVHGHRVAGVDVTEDYVAAARTLTRLIGLEDRVRFTAASALHLPFPHDTFDAAIQLHLGMNVADKAALVAEVARVLRPGAPFAIYDVMGEADAAVDLPVPWASTPDASHLATADTYVSLLEGAGFRVRHVRDRRDFAMEFFAGLRGRSEAPPPIGLHLLMGPDAPVKLRNTATAVERGAIAPVEIVAVTGA